MKVILIRYSEIHLKGNNKRYFENMLTGNIKRKLAGLQYKLSYSSGRYIISDYEQGLSEQFIDQLKCVFGIYSVSIAEVIDNDIELIAAKALQLSPSSGTFKIVTNRADKSFCLNSMQVSCEIGSRLLQNNNLLRVDLHHPQSIIYIDIRESGKTYLFSDIIRCCNGMPVGTGGKGMVLLSGGIDSPVACYMMAKRGMSLRAVHFHSYPYTSISARDKVLELARIVKNYSLAITVDVVSFTKIQTTIHEKCPHELLITIMRRFMMRIAEKLAVKHGCQAIITGESLGQVASQTIESITSTNSVSTLPVLRPLIAFDKDEIVELAKKIHTFDTSILPYEDCCTIFLPKNPVTKPKLSTVERFESLLDIDELVEDALCSVETFII